MLMILFAKCLVFASISLHCTAVEAVGNDTMSAVPTLGPTPIPVLPPPPPPPKPKPKPTPFPPPDGSDSPTVEVAVYEAKVYSSTSTPYNRFGHALSSYGTVVAVGSARESTTASVGLFSVSVVTPTAAAEVSYPMAASLLDVEVGHQAANVTWSQQQAVAVESSERYYDGFGTSLAMGPFTLAVGAPYSASSAAGVASGAVFAFSMSSDQQATGDYAVLTAPTSDASFNMQFGSAVALQGTALAVGAPGASMQGRMSGAVYLYQYAANGSWVQDAVLQDVDGGAQYARYGGTVCLSEDGAFLAVGASGYSKHVIHGGAVFLYYKTAARRRMQESTNDTTSAENGGGDDEAEQDDQAESSSAWALHSLLVPSSLQAYAYFGRTMAFRGTVGLVSAYDSDGSGVVYLFQHRHSEEDRRSLRDRGARRLSAASWVLVEILRPTASTTMNEFGASLAIFHTSDASETSFTSTGAIQLVDAYVVAVGSPGDTAEAASARRTGAVYLYLSPYDAPEGSGHAGASTWALLTKATASDDTAYNQYGQALALMGAHLLVGAELADTDAAQRAGAVYVETNLIPYLVAAAQEGTKDDDGGAGEGGDDSAGEDSSNWRSFWIFFSTTGGVVTMSFVPVAVLAAFFVAHKKRKGDKVLPAMVGCTVGESDPMVLSPRDGIAAAGLVSSPTASAAAIAAENPLNSAEKGLRESAQNPLLSDASTLSLVRGTTNATEVLPEASLLERMWSALSAMGGATGGQHALLPQHEATDGTGTVPADMRVMQTQLDTADGPPQLSIRSPITHVPAHSSLVLSPTGRDFPTAPVASFRVAAPGVDGENAQSQRGGRHQLKRSLGSAVSGGTAVPPIAKGEETIRV